MPAEARRIVENLLDVEQSIIGALNGDAGTKARLSTRPASTLRASTAQSVSM
jgi:hypothetical protein